ncbi:(2Fe-2S) ferredoxin domain-containing protein [Merismopedia glauca]|uniref:(Fe-S)-binding protein n=1 Tax=Merismopedia glauca CCAP 1448/3 TaxID=1296344 RepID=A0A2T1C4J6_9CYAN|nr:(2Fe-2S) ferredoxin domain-containing protein [Merismopedia glauca]PSB03043.1 (Fe-S)-binding protein [Merismopedia glauca CCAP 1448/3]
MPKSKQITKFAIAGKFIGFTLKDDNQIKEIQLQTYKGEVWIKPNKELRPTLKNVISVGDLVIVEGEKHLNDKNGQTKLKAHLVTLKQPAIAVEATKHPDPLLSCTNNLLAKSINQQPIASILICQKSDCQKRGSQNVCRQIEEALRDRGLESQIIIKKVGCIKQCKSGPHMVLMPDKTRYSEVKPSRIPELIERHFSGYKQPQSA